MLCRIQNRWFLLVITPLLTRTGVAIFEATDAIALSRYLARWNPFMDIDVAPVLDDEESARLARFTLEDHGA